MNAEQKPLISIILPVYNCQKYLCQCIDSIISQTFTQWELIIIDDGSNDGSSEICDEYSARDKRIFVVHKENTGVSDSRNIAIRLCKGEWVGFVDADDWVEPEMYSKLYAAAIEENADVSVCGLQMDFLDKSAINAISEKRLCFNKQESLRVLWRKKPFQNYLCDKLFRREVVSDIFPVGQKYEDVYVLPRWFMNVEKCVVINDVLYHYRMRHSSITNCGSMKNELDFMYSQVSIFYYLCDETGVLKAAGDVSKRMVEYLVRIISIAIVRYANSFAEAEEYLAEIKEAYLKIKARKDYSIRFKDRLLALRLRTSLKWYYYRIKFVLQLKKMYKKDRTNSLYN